MTETASSVNPKFMTHVVIDAESLGTRDNAVILQFSAIAYHLTDDANKSLSELVATKSFNMKLNASEQIAAGRSVDEDTLKWWSKQSAAAQEILKPLPDDKTMAEFHTGFQKWLDDVGYDRKFGFVWSRGMIDTRWTDTMWRQLGIAQDDYPVFYYRVRDIRTAVDVSGTSSRLNGVPDEFWKQIKVEFPEVVDHDSLHDCAKQILQLKLAGII